MLPVDRKQKYGTAPNLKKIPFIRTHQRDNHIVMRWYFYKTAFNDLSYHRIVQQLMWEFYLAAPTIMKVLESNKAEMDRMVQANTRFCTCKKLAPHFSWNADDFLGLPRKQKNR
ncbi:MAG: hypothetical protein K8F30_00065 [Taibaiella sp.]|nr:hypothetical protein [Taibaiella sp.]